MVQFKCVGSECMSISVASVGGQCAGIPHLTIV